MDNHPALPTGIMGTRPGGEIGRRKGLKIPRPNGRAGSIPAPGTTFINRIYAWSHQVKPGQISMWTHRRRFKVVNICLLTTGVNIWQKVFLADFTNP